MKIVLKFVIYLMLLSTCTFPTRSETENGFKDMQIFPGTKVYLLFKYVLTNLSNRGVTTGGPVRPISHLNILVHTYKLPQPDFGRSVT